MTASAGDHFRVEGETGWLGLPFTPTIWAFIDSDVEVPILMASRREGKTVGGIAAIIHHRDRMQSAGVLKAAIVRDTWRNLQRTICETMREGHIREWWDVEFREGGTEAWLNGSEGVHVWLFGMDRPADANKFQSFEAGLVSIEEPAPAADLASGVPVDVFGMAVSSLSQVNVPPRLQIIMNPPDEEHWTLEVAAFLEEKNRADFRVATFWVPPGENPHLQAGYRERMRLGFEVSNRQDLVMRLVEGKVATVSTGEAVTPEFSDLHLFKDENGKPQAAPMSPRWPTFRFFDFGHNPTVIWAQLTPMGWLNVLGAIVGENIGIEELIEQELLPWQARFGMMPTTSRVDSFGKVARSGYSFRDIGDAAARIREQTSTRRSAAWTLERMLRTSFEAAPIDWTSRRNAVKGALNRNIGGRPMVMFDPFECKPLIKALRGGWRFAKGKDGKVSRLPIKDKSSHPGDAFAYGCAVLFPSYVSVTPAMPRETKLVLPPARGFLGR